MKIVWSLKIVKGGGHDVHMMNILIINMNIHVVNFWWVLVLAPSTLGQYALGIQIIY